MGWKETRRVTVGSLRSHELTRALLGPGQIVTQLMISSFEKGPSRKGDRDQAVWKLRTEPLCHEEEEAACF